MGYGSVSLMPMAGGALAITAWISVRNFCPDAGIPAVVPCRLDETPERLV